MVLAFMLWEMVADSIDNVVTVSLGMVPGTQSKGSVGLMRTGEGTVGCLSARVSDAGTEASLRFEVDLTAGTRGGPADFVLPRVSEAGTGTSL